MRRLVFGIFPCLFSLLLVFLFGIGILRFDTDNPLLRSVDGHAGFLYQVIPTDLSPRVRSYFDQASLWLGSPCVTPTRKTTGRALGETGGSGGPGGAEKAVSDSMNPLY